MTKDEALKQALDALESMACTLLELGEQTTFNEDQAIIAIKEALAQPDYRAVKTYHEGKPVYVSQPEQKPVGEVNRYGLDSHGRQWHGIYWYDANVDVPHGTKLYTAPPKRPWVGLTDEQIGLAWLAINDPIALGGVFKDGDHVRQFAQAIEAKLKEKNT